MTDRHPSSFRSHRKSTRTVDLKVVRAPDLASVASADSHETSSDPFLILDTPLSPSNCAREHPNGGVELLFAQPVGELRWLYSIAT